MALEVPDRLLPCAVIANMRGASEVEVANRLVTASGLQGLQGPTISPIYTLDQHSKVAQQGLYAAVVCVPKKRLYACVKTLQRVGVWGSNCSGWEPGDQITRPGWI